MSLTSDLLPGIPAIESPLFWQSVDEMELSPHEKEVAVTLNERGYAVIDFLDDDLDARIGRIIESLSPRYGIDFFDPESIKNTGDLRIQDAWKFNDDVLAIACNRAGSDTAVKALWPAGLPLPDSQFSCWHSAAHA